MKRVLLPSLVTAAAVVVALLLSVVSGAVAFSPLPKEAAEDSVALLTSVPFPGAFQNTKDTATILAFGDMMLDRTVRVAIETNGPEYPFVPLKEFLRGADIVVANAEGAFTDSASVSVTNHALLEFTFDPAELPTLQKLGFTLFSQANNHALNFGAAGLKESQALIRASGMETFGDPLNEDPGPYYQTVKGERIAFIGYHQFSGTDSNVLSAIREAHREGAFTIVYPHWGVEYSPTMTAFQQTEAHAFIDAGADLILGAHPHVVEPIEVYKGKAIFYSLGNFIFDQSNSGPTSLGLSVGIRLEKHSVSYWLFPLQISHSQASLLSPGARADLLGGAADTASLSRDDAALRQDIASGSFTLSRN